MHPTHASCYCRTKARWVLSAIVQGAWGVLIPAFHLHLFSTFIVFGRTSKSGCGIMNEIKERSLYDTVMDDGHLCLKCFKGVFPNAPHRRLRYWIISVVVHSMILMSTLSILSSKLPWMIRYPLSGPKTGPVHIVTVYCMSLFCLWGSGLIGETQRLSRILPIRLIRRLVTIGTMIFIWRSQALSLIVLGMTFFILSNRPISKSKKIDLKSS